AAGVIAALAVMPGMPAAVLLPAAAVAGFIAWRLSRKAPAPAPELPGAVMAQPTIEWSDVTESAPVLLEIGYGLIPLVDEAGPLMTRITGIRRQLSQELGFVLPLVRVRDNLGLAPQSYRISIGEEYAGSGEAWPADLLAHEAEAILVPVQGRQVRDPAFGMAARWIDPAQESEAIGNGYTVVDCATVVGTHVYKLLKDRAHILFGQDDVQGLLDALAVRHPQLAASVSSKSVPLALTTALCQALLEEGISLRGFPRIASAMAQHVGTIQDPAQLVEAVRTRIGGLILAGLGGADAQPDRPLQVIALAPRLEALLVAAQRAAPLADYPFEPGLGARLAESVAEASAGPLARGDTVALVTQPGPRRALWRLLRQRPAIAVLAFSELQDSRPVEVAAVVGEDLLDAIPQIMEPA
ncbi:MAG: FHIPEP family type III secretion protein, partial [Sandaracinobacteroides sp.]